MICTSLRKCKLNTIFIFALFLFQFAPLQGFTQTITKPTRQSYLKLSQLFFERITGVKISIKDSRVTQMADLLVSGKPKSAVEIALKDPMFTQVRARNFAIQLSTKSNALNVDFNDSAALITGIIRDDIDFREILTADYHYELKNGNSYQNNFNQTLNNAMIELEGSFLPLESAGNSIRRFLNLHNELVKVDKIQVPIQYNIGKLNTIMMNNGLGKEKERGSLIDQGVLITKNHPDAAGILTSRNFAASNYSGGTNRRPVEFVVKNFLCSSMGEIANTNTSDAYVGKDVSRFPGGSYQTYTTSCKGCHTIMDSWRGAFAKSDFVQPTTEAGAGDYLGIFHGELGIEYKSLLSDWQNKYVTNAAEVNEQAKAVAGADTTLKKSISTYLDLNYWLHTIKDKTDYPTNYQDRIKWEKTISAFILDFPQYFTTILSSYQSDKSIPALCNQKDSLIKKRVDNYMNPGDANQLIDIRNYATIDNNASTEVKCYNFLYTAITNYAYQLTAKNSAIFNTEWKKQELTRAFLNNRIYIKNIELAKASLRYSKYAAGLDSLTRILNSANLNWALANKALKTETDNAKINLYNDMIAESKIIFGILVNQVPSNPVDTNVNSLIQEVSFLPVSKPAALTLKSNYSVLQNQLTYFMFTSEQIIRDVIIHLKITNNFDTTLDYNQDLKDNNVQSIIGKNLVSLMNNSSISPELKTLVTYLIKYIPDQLLESDRFFSRAARRNFYTSTNEWLFTIPANINKSTGVVNKMNNGSFPQGFEVTDDRFYNLAAGSYGWRGPYSTGGKGLKQFGQMIADSEAFSRCISKKIFQNVCQKNIDQDKALIESLKKSFEENNYNIRSLIMNIIFKPQCGLIQGAK